MQKQAKVTEVKENLRKWDGPKGTLYYHEIYFDNGDKGQWGSISITCDKFKAGEIADYTIEEKESNGYKNYIIRPVQQNGAGGFKPKDNKDQGIITALSCLSSSVNLHARTSNSSAEDVIRDAEKFFNYAMSKTTK